MIRTQIQLTLEQMRGLKEAAARQGRSVAERLVWASMSCRESTRRQQAARGSAPRR